MNPKETSNTALKLFLCCWRLHFNDGIFRVRFKSFIIDDATKRFSFISEEGTFNWIQFQSKLTDALKSCLRVIMYSLEFLKELSCKFANCKKDYERTHFTISQKLLILESNGLPFLLFDHAVIVDIFVTTLVALVESRISRLLMLQCTFRKRWRHC